LKKLLLLLIVLYGCTRNQQLFDLNNNTYGMWQKFIRPTKDELAWAEIPWRSTFYDGLVESDREQKPLLLWVMNGHPLGCT